MIARTNCLIRLPEYGCSKALIIKHGETIYNNTFVRSLEVCECINSNLLIRTPTSIKQNIKTIWLINCPIFI